MAIPDNKFSDVQSPGPFQWPADKIFRGNPLLDYEQGGVAIGDTSKGNSSFMWRARVDGDDVLLSREPHWSEQVVYTRPGIKRIALGLSQNMDINLAMDIGDDVVFWWYDPTLPGQTETTFSNRNGCALTLDDKREVLVNQQSDVLLFYLDNVTLKFRQQSERYGTERTLATWEAGLQIGRIGMNTSAAFQVEQIKFIENRGIS